MTGCGPPRSGCTTKVVVLPWMVRMSIVRSIMMPLRVSAVRIYEKHRAAGQQGDAGRLARRGLLLEQDVAHHLREQHVDQAQRAHARRRRQREGEEPELRRRGAHEAG